MNPREPPAAPSESPAETRGTMETRKGVSPVEGRRKATRALPASITAAIRRSGWEGVPERFAAPKEVKAYIIQCNDLKERMNEVKLIGYF